MGTDDDLHSLVAQYREAAEGMSNEDPTIANRWHGIAHSCYKRLRSSTTGRALITTLMLDASPHVRCSAAAHSLQWDPDTARAVLEALRDAKGPCSFEAEMILAEFDKGRLTFDY
jgi:hypothetical protein